MQSGGISEEDEKDFQAYCDKQEYTKLERCEYRFDIVHTSHYNVFCLGRRAEELKSEIKNALPKWLKWIIK